MNNEDNSASLTLFSDILQIEKAVQWDVRPWKVGAIRAEFWVPVQSVDVKQHGSAGVGHICAVDAARLPTSQTLLEIHRKHTPMVSLFSSHMHILMTSTPLPTQMSQESTVPNIARCDTTASWTSSTLSISQRSFTALK